MKYAIIQISGKQLLIKPNLWYDINYIKNGLENQYLKVNKILLFRNNNILQIGKPFLNNSIIYTKIIQHFKGKKITILKTKPKKNYTRKFNYKSKHTRIQFKNIF